MTGTENQIRTPGVEVAIFLLMSKEGEKTGLQRKRRKGGGQEEKREREIEERKRKGEGER